MCTSVKVVVATQPGRELLLKPGLKFDFSPAAFCALAKAQAATFRLYELVPPKSELELHLKSVLWFLLSQVGADAQAWVTVPP